MRIARVMGKVVLHASLPEWPHGALLLCEALEDEGLRDPDVYVPRRKPMPESLVVFDEIGAGRGDLVALSEGREAAMPWHPDGKPIDAYCVAILDTIQMDDNTHEPEHPAAAR